MQSLETQFSIDAFLLESGCKMLVLGSRILFLCLLRSGLAIELWSAWYSFFWDFNVAFPPDG